MPGIDSFRYGQAGPSCWESGDILPMIRKLTLRLLVVSTAVALASGQTQIDLQHQARGIDFTAATYTKPLQLGSSLPATCMIGQAFMMTGALLPARISIFA